MSLTTRHLTPKAEWTPNAPRSGHDFRASSPPLGARSLELNVYPESLESFTRQDFHSSGVAQQLAACPDRRPGKPTRLAAAALRALCLRGCARV